MKIFLRTYGCQMNEYDSELVKSILLKEGCRFIDSEKKADIILLNTCTVRETATRKVFGHVYEFRHALGKKPLIGILGCMATDAKQSLFKNKKLGIDFICGPDSYKKLPALIKEAQEKHKVFDVDLSQKENYSEIYPARQKGVNAWVAITRGCNNFCTFCIVPYVRGRERSRTPKNILNEIKRLVREGFPQATLLGQNVNSYSSGQYDFPKLLDEISQVKGLKRIRFMSPHPKDFPPNLIDLITQRANICKHIHLPLQSGSTRILKLMNRRYTKEGFLRLVDKIRAKCPHIALTTDIIIGFPTETEKDFKDTLQVVQKVQFDSAFIFKYSPRNGTLAERQYKDDIAADDKTKRIIYLNAVQKEICLKQNKRLLGQTQELMIEERTSNGWRGRTDTNKVVSVSEGEYKAGDLVYAKIINASANGLSGEASE